MISVAEVRIFCNWNSHVEYRHTN